MKRKPSIFTPETIKKIQEMYQQKIPVRKIAQVLGLNHNSIYVIFTRKGIRFAPQKNKLSYAVMWDLFWKFKKAKLNIKNNDDVITFCKRNNISYAFFKKKMKYFTGRWCPEPKEDK